MKKLLLFLSAIFLLNVVILAQSAESETNDIISESNNFAVNSSMDGQIGVLTDKFDWYKIITPYDGELSFVGIPQSTLNLFLTLVDSDSTTILSYGINGQTGENDSLTFSYLKAGTYFLLCSQVNSGTYTLTNVFTPTSIPEGNDTEPNNGIQEAISLSIDSTVTGHLGYYNNKQTDVFDWYSITIPYEGDLSFVAIPESTLDIRLAFIGSDGTTVLSYGYNGAMGENNTLSMQNLSAGTYYLLLSQFGYGSYSLQTSFEETSTSIKVLEKYGFS